MWFGKEKERESYASIPSIAWLVKSRKNVVFLHLLVDQYAGSSVIREVEESYPSHHTTLKSHN